MFTLSFLHAAIINNNDNKKKTHYQANHIFVLFSFVTTTRIDIHPKVHNSALFLQIPGNPAVAKGVQQDTGYRGPQ